MAEIEPVVIPPAPVVLLLAADASTAQIACVCGKTHDVAAGVTYACQTSGYTYTASLNGRGQLVVVTIAP